MCACLLLFRDSLGVFHPILLLLVGQDRDLGGGRGARSAVHPLWTWWFLQTEPATRDKVFTLALAGCLTPSPSEETMARRREETRTGRSHTHVRFHSLAAFHHVIDNSILRSEQETARAVGAGLLSTNKIKIVAVGRTTWHV